MNRDPSLHIGNTKRIVRRTLAAIVGALMVTTAACSSSEKPSTQSIEALRENETPVQKASQLERALNNDKMVSRVSVALGESLPLQQEQVGESNGSNVYQPIRLGQHIYGYAEINQSTGHLLIRIVHSDQPLTSQPSGYDMASEPHEELVTLGLVHNDQGDHWLGINEGVGRVPAPLVTGYKGENEIINPAIRSAGDITGF